MIKSFKNFELNEDAAATASTAGMGSVVTASSGTIAGAAFTGNGTVGSGDIGVQFGIYTKYPAYNNLGKKKKGKKEKEPKKYKFSDMIKFEDFDTTKYLLENFDLMSMDSKQFSDKMDKVVASLAKTSKAKAKDWKDVQQKDLFDKLDVKNWKDAYDKDPSACIAYKSRLDDYFNKPEDSIKE